MSSFTRLGAGGSGENVDSAPKALSIIQQMLVLAEKNLTLTVGVLIGVFVLIVAIVALVVYQTRSNQKLVDLHGQVENGHAAVCERNGGVTKEDDEGVPVLLIILVVFAGILIVVGIGWRLYPRHFKERSDGVKTSTKGIEKPPSLSNAEADIEELFTALQKHRSGLPPDLRCVAAVKDESPDDRPRRVLIWDVDQVQRIDCPNNFTPNSVWWAFKDAADYLVLPFYDVFGLYIPTAQPDPALSIWSQYQPLRNIPGDVDIPFYTKAAETTDLVKAFEEEYEKWHIWAIKDKECNQETTDGMVPVEIYGHENSTPENIYCNTANPTIKSVYSAFVRGVTMGESKFEVYISTENTFVAGSLSVDKKDIEGSRALIWHMYEPFSPVHFPRKYVEEYFK